MSDMCNFVVCIINVIIIRNMDNNYKYKYDWFLFYDWMYVFRYI